MAIWDYCTLHEEGRVWEYRIECRLCPRVVFEGVVVMLASCAMTISTERRKDHARIKQARSVAARRFASRGVGVSRADFKTFH